MSNRRNPPARASRHGDDPTRRVSTLFLEGFSRQEITRLLQTRTRLTSGSLSEWQSANHKRLLFARWLVEHGRMGEEL